MTSREVLTIARMHAMILAANWNSARGDSPLCPGIGSWPANCSRISGLTMISSAVRLSPRLSPRAAYPVVNPRLI